MRIPDHIHHELLNWSRWCWMGEWPHPLPSTQCGSLEGQFRAPPEWDMDLAEAPRNYIRPNERMARLVQSAFDEMEQMERIVLRAEYPARLESGRMEGRHCAAQRIGVPVWMYERHLQSAVDIVGGTLEVRERGY